MPELIPVHFFSNEKSLKDRSWPRCLVCRPIIGDIVVSTEERSTRWGVINAIYHTLDPDHSPMLRIQLKEI